MSEWKAFCDYTASIGLACDRLLENARRPYYEGRINPLRAGWSYMPEGVRPGPVPLTFRADQSIGKMWEYHLGLVYPQSHSSLLPAFSLSPAPGETILDAFSAPGSKTTLMAALMENRGAILAVERYKKRIRAVYGNLKRLGVLNTNLWLGDVRHVRGLFDGVLADVPCTGLGSSSWNPASANKMASYQRSLISSLAKRVREGGLLVYSTCSLSLEENERVVQWILENTDLELVHHGLKLHSPGLTELGAERWKVLRINGPEIGSEAFFVAKFIKTL